MIIDMITVHAWQENCYLLVDDSTGKAVLIDPGAEGERILGMLDKSGAELQAVWLTHAHIDHIGALAHVKRKYDVPVYMHAADVPVFEAAPFLGQVYGFPFEETPLPDREINDGDIMRVGGLEFTAMHTPGHAPGHIVYHGNNTVFCGDLLFAGSIGRTDLPLCNPQHMAESLKKVVGLPGSYKALPGHGPSTTIQTEINNNPFLNGTAYVKQSY